VDARHKAGHDEEIVPLNIVIVSEAKQSIATRKTGLLRRFAPRNDGRLIADIVARMERSEIRESQR
jgi:hypothetical protein